MQSKATEKDQWFSDDWGRGDGRFLGRVTPKGRSCFYFRYTLPDGSRDTLLIGDYSKDGKGGVTLADARAVALEWSKLYKGKDGTGKDGVKNLREHFAEQARQWSDVDLVSKVWHIPAENSKNGKAHIVHLSGFAAKHIEALALLKESGNPWLFPATKGKAKDAMKPMLPTSINKQLTDRQRSDDAKRTRRTPQTAALVLPHGGWSSHDLRRTAATMMSTLQIRIEVIHKCLNHSLDDELAGVYVQDEMLDERRKAFEALGNLLDSTLNPRTVSNVVQLHSAAWLLRTLVAPLHTLGAG
jgi:hypothetical protein